MTTRDEISEWFDRGVKKGATHMIVVCDTYEHDDYPVYVSGGHDEARRKYNEYLHGTHSMQKVMEVYNLSADKAEQMGERRCFRF